jgi:DNA-binding transcriptional MerR regulator
MRQNKRQAPGGPVSRPIKTGEVRPLKIGELAKRVGVGVETLRFYERSGLLDQPARTRAGYRLYDDEALKALEFIRRAQTLGFTLEEIRRIMDESRAGQSPCAEVREIVRRRLADLDQRMRQMRLYRKALAGALRQWDESGASEGDFCGLIEHAKIDVDTPEPEGLRRRKK